MRARIRGGVEKRTEFEHLRPPSRRQAALAGPQTLLKHLHELIKVLHGTSRCSRRTARLAPVTEGSVYMDAGKDLGLDVSQVHETSLNPGTLLP